MENSGNGKGRTDARPEELSIRPLRSVWGTLVGNTNYNAGRVPVWASFGFPAILVVKGILTLRASVKKADRSCAILPKSQRPLAFNSIFQ